MSGSLAALCVEAPAAGDGEAVGYGTWRLVVRFAIPYQAEGIWGESTWKSGATGNGLWSRGYEWLDISDRYQGGQWTRGREGLLARPETGTATVDLSNPDGYFSPWNEASTFPQREYLVPGSLVQFGWWDPSASSWQPAFTGLIDSLVEHASELDAGLWMTLELFETTGWLSLIDGIEQPAAGAGETSDLRMTRLLDEAGWPYGTNIGGWYSPFDTATLQATTMAQNRLAEVYLTADSVFWDAFSGRDGRLATWAKGYAEYWYYANGTTIVGFSEESGTLSTVRFMPWMTAPEIHTDTEDIMNDVTVTRVGGGTVQGFDTASVNKYGRQSYKRTDLILADDTALDDWVADALSVNANNATKVTGLDVHADMDPQCFEALTRLDFGRTVYLRRQTPRQPTLISTVLFMTQVYGYTVGVTVHAPGIIEVTATLHVVVKVTTTSAPS